MSAMDTSHLEAPSAARQAAIAVRNAVLILVGLVVGAIAGLVIAAYAGWLPRIDIC